MVDAKIRELARASSSGDSEAGWSYIRSVERIGGVVDAADDRAFHFSFDSPGGEQPTNFWVFSNRWALARFAEGGIYGAAPQRRPHRFMLLKQSSWALSSVYADVEPLGRFQDAEWEELNKLVNCQQYFVPRFGNLDEFYQNFPSVETAVNFVLNLKVDPASMPSFAERLQADRRPPKRR